MCVMEAHFYYTLLCRHGTIVPSHGPHIFTPHSLHILYTIRYCVIQVVVHFYVDMGRWSPRLALTFFTPHSLYILYTIGYCVIQEVVSHGELIGNFTSVSKFKIDRHTFQP